MTFDDGSSDDDDRSIRSEFNNSGEMTFDDRSSDDDDRSERSEFNNTCFTRKCGMAIGFVALAFFMTFAIFVAPIISIIYFVVSVVHFPLHSQDLSVNSVETTNLTEIL